VQTASALVMCARRPNDHRLVRTWQILLQKSLKRDLGCGPAASLRLRIFPVLEALRTLVTPWPRPQTARLKRGIVPLHCMGMTPVGGSHVNPHPTARIHWHAWQRGSRVFACGARAAHQHRCRGERRLRGHTQDVSKEISHAIPGLTHKSR
jgi:hypothetical protein